MSLNGIFQHTDLYISLIACEEVVRHVLIYHHWCFNLVLLSALRNTTTYITLVELRNITNTFIIYFVTMSSEKARKLNTREIFVYTLVRTWYIRPVLCGHWMDDFMYRGSGGGGGAWNNNTCYKREHLPFLKKFLKVHIAALLKPLPVSWTRSLSCRIIIMDSRIYFMIR